MSDIYETFDRSLYKEGNATYTDNLLSVDVNATSMQGLDPINIGSGGSLEQLNQYVGSIVAGKQGFTNNEAGYILGIDKGVPKFYIGNTTDYLNWDGTTLTVSGTFNLGYTLVTISDIADLQAALDGVALLGGGTVSLVPNTYIATSSFTIASGVTLEGNGSTIDFNAGAFQVLIQGTNAYSTGTVAVNFGSGAVVGTGTTWTAGMVGQSILIGDYWYTITSRTDNTHITIEYSAGNAFMGTNVSGVSYVIATTIDGSSVNNVTLTNSSTTALRFRYVNGLNMNALVVTNSAQAIDGDDSVNVNLQDGYTIDDCVFGITYDNVPFCVFKSGLISNITGGTGIALTGVTNTALDSLSIQAITGVGAKLTNCANFGFAAWSIIECTSHGLELVSGNNDVDITSGYCNTCGGDGIKLTTTSDRNTIVACSFLNNTGYGVNIAAASCDDNKVLAPAFSNNTAGTVNDLGTGTFISPQTTGLITAITTLPTPAFLSNTYGVVLVNSNTTAFAGKVYIPSKITVTRISYYADHNVNGTYKIALFTEDGQTQIFSYTTPTISTDGLHTDTISSTIIYPGFYYIVMLPVGTASASFRISVRDNTVGGALDSIASAPVTSGTITVTASTMPSTITPSAITSANNAGLIFRLDI